MKNIVERMKGVPSAVLVLSAGFIMAASTSLNTAIVISVAVFASLMLSALVMCLLGKVIPTYAKLPVYILVTTGFVSLIHMLLQAYYPAAVETLGVYIATLAVSLVAFGEANKKQKTSVLDALLTGVLFVVIMIVCALIREALGNATIGGEPVEFLEEYKIPTLASTFGGYIVLAVVMALINKITGMNKDAKEDN